MHTVRLVRLNHALIGASILSQKLPMYSCSPFGRNRRMNQLQSTMLVRHDQTTTSRSCWSRSLIVSNQPAFSVTRQRSTHNECHWSVGPIRLPLYGNPHEAGVLHVIHCCTIRINHECTNRLNQGWIVIYQAPMLGMECVLSTQDN